MAKTIIHWFRRDLRLTDNAALDAAARASAQVVPAYVLSGWRGTHSWTGPARQQFLCGCLESLARNLESRGSRLVLRCGHADEELQRLVKETQAGAVFFNRLHEPHGRAMEDRVRQMCARAGIEFRAFDDALLQPPERMLSGEGRPYRVFTPFWRRWVALPRETAEKTAPVLTGLGDARLDLSMIHSEPLPRLDHWALPRTAAELPAAGERAARERMRRFVASPALSGYASGRDLPGEPMTSRLSQDLRFGLISIRELVARAAASEVYLKELAWREFYMAVLHHFPEVFDVEFQVDFRGLPWPGTDEAFKAWREGRTGFPIVDAAMRQLRATGWMHNRARMITAMFLTKDLHCDWRLGESFFMQHLVDGEAASNNGGWQWSAGTGADAAPYFRIQNPWTQTRRYDPQGRYIKRWLPELAHLPAEKLMAPPADGRPLVPGYPAPIVDHAKERERCLARFAQHRRERT